MRPEIAPFLEEHTSGAASLLAARHRRVREKEPGLPPRFEDEREAKAVLDLARTARGAQGVVALRKSQVLGFLLGEVVTPAPSALESMTTRPRAARMRYGWHAVSAGEEELYHALYAALAPRWLAVGCFAHYVMVPASEEEALSAFFSLGFGKEMVRAARSTEEPLLSSPDGVEIRPGTPEDMEEILRLSQDLGRHHALSPIFLPYLSEPLLSLSAGYGKFFSSPEAACFLAWKEGRAVGLQDLEIPASAEMSHPERCAHLHRAYTEASEQGRGVGRALFARAMEWARGRGAARCFLGHMTANPSAARFWRTLGFRPVSYRLCRFVDERIAWANGR